MNLHAIFQSQYLAAPEMQFYSIRHLQQHTDERMERLGSRAGVEVDWVGKVGG